MVQSNSSKVRSYKDKIAFGISAITEVNELKNIYITYYFDLHLDFSNASLKCFTYTTLNPQQAEMDWETKAWERFVQLRYKSRLFGLHVFFTFFSKYLINLRRQFCIRKIFSCT